MDTILMFELIGIAYFVLLILFFFKLKKEKYSCQPNQKKIVLFKTVIGVLFAIFIVFVIYIVYTFNHQQWHLNIFGIA